MFQGLKRIKLHKSLQVKLTAGYIWTLQLEVTSANCERGFQEHVWSHRRWWCACPELTPGEPEICTMPAGQLHRKIKATPNCSVIEKRFKCCCARLNEYQVQHVQYLGRFHFSRYGDKLINAKVFRCILVTCWCTVFFFFKSDQHLSYRKCISMCSESHFTTPWWMYWCHKK